MTKIAFDIIPDAVVRLCTTLRDAGHEAYLVGGGVRDLVLGRQVHDWDVTTSARPRQVQRLFRRTIPTGIKHGTVTVLTQGGELPVEVTTYRGDGAYTDGRRPDNVTFVASLEQDLRRRDFTINAMALDPVARQVVDPLHGERDLDARLIRAVGRAAARFEEDGLRVMRAVRFAAVLEFDVEQQTLDAIGGCLERFGLISAERVRDELLKLLQSRRPSVGLELMRRTRLLGVVLPELAAGIGLQQNRHHPDDVYTHSLAVCDAVPGDEVLRLAALLHDVGKVVTARAHPDRPGEMTFHGHERQGAEICQQVARRLKLSNAQRERLCHLVAQHMFPLEGYSAAGLRRMLRRVGPEHLPDVLTLRAADAGSKRGATQRLQQLEQLRQALDQIQQSAPPLSTSQLAINGRVLIDRLGLEPGPRIGQLMRAMLEQVTDDPALNEVEALVELARRLNDKLL